MFKVCLSRILLFCLSLSSVIVVFGFNLFPKHAIVFEEPSGQKGSYFGYTVALQEDSRLVVGAPRGNSTHPHHLNITEPGVVYHCQLDGDKNCTSHLLDSTGNDRNEEREYLQDKNNAWTGGSMDVQSGRNGQIAVCGPRWTNLFYASKGKEMVSGICYIVDTSNSEKNAEKLMPLNKFSNFYYKKRARDMSFVRKMSYFYAFGQAGMSIHFTKGQDEMIVGAPGIMDWTGTVIRYKTNDYKNPVIPNPVRTSVLKNYANFGYSLSSGNFLKGQNKTYYVGGAPRAGRIYQGMVYIFDFHVAAPANKDEEHRLEVVQELKGEQSGEYFGAALCVVDVNGDGLDDILVGAPRHAGKTWDQGQLYVHLTSDTRGKLTFTSKQMVGSRQSGAQYGTAVSSLGDINKDGYNDFVVGAPYEDSGTGAIYIYHGGKTGPRSKFAQRIVGTEIRPDILGFGISFSRSLDIDGNNYNDFAVGAYKSGHAIVLKTHPVIGYAANVTANVPSIDFNATSFSITACVLYTGTHVPATVVTQIILTLDKIFQRVVPNEIKSDLTVRKDVGECKEYPVKIKSSLQDFSKPITLTMKYHIKNDSNGDTFSKFYPVADPKKLNPVDSELPYYTGCSSKIVCRPDLSIRVYFVDAKTPLIIGSQKTLSLMVSLRNEGEPAFLAYAYVTLPASCSLTSVPQDCDEVTQGASENQLKCLMGNPLAEGKEKTVQLDMNVEDVEIGTERLEFNVRATSTGSEIDAADNKKNLTLTSKTLADIGVLGSAIREGIFFPKENEIEEAGTEFSHMYEVKNFGPSPVNKISLEFKIPVSHTSAKNFVQIHEIQARHDSKPVECERSDVPSVKLRKHLDILINDSEQTNTTEQSASFSDEVTTEDENITESSNISKSEEAVRKIRLLNIFHDLARQDLYTPTEGKFSIDCSNPDTTCVTVRCNLYRPIRNLSRAVITFNMFANFKKLEYFLGNSDAILFITTGRAKIESPSNVEQTEENRPDEAYVTTTFHGPIREGAPDPIIIYASAAGALVLLIIIVIILCMFGFFKRKRPPKQYGELIKETLQEE